MVATANELRVLNFHGIGNPGRTLEPGEDDYWIGLSRLRDVLDRVASHPDHERLSLTFDDGNISDLEIATPELQRRGLTAEFFVLTGRIGETGSLRADDIRALIGAGMRIGSHGVTHRDWTGLSARALDDELNLSKAMLEHISGEPVLSAAIPFGRYNSAVLEALRKAGYTAAYSSDGGSTEASAFLRPRTSIRRDTANIALERMLSGQVPAWRRLRRTATMSIKRWA